jgi:muramoyltetrapeptide carboxypeptidase LdcA involved in peptidoglycan recycling
MEKIYPEKLKRGDEVRVVAPSGSMAKLSKEIRETADRRFSDLGLKLSFGKHVEEKDDPYSSSIGSRVQDMHDAFSDKNVKAVLTVIGGFNSNQILKYLDWELIRNNPKIFCGYSDITVLNNAIFQKTGLVNYYGPHYSTFGQKLYFDYTLDYFKKCLMRDGLFEIEQSEDWSDDKWYGDQEGRTLIKNEGWRTINEGVAEGTVIGGNLCTFNLLQGTDYFPETDKSLLFIEDDGLTGKFSDGEFDRNLQSIMDLPQFKSVKGIAIGRFQKASEMAADKVFKIARSKKELNGIPVIADVDFGHTDPKITFPIGGEAKLEAVDGKMRLEILEH